MKYFTIIDNKVYDKKLYKCLSEGKYYTKDKLNNGTEFVIISVPEAYKAVKGHEDLVSISKDIENNPKKHCPCCGAMTNSFLQDYREVGGTISRYISCSMCIDLNNSVYFELLRSTEPAEQKFEEYLEFMKNISNL